MKKKKKQGSKWWLWALIIFLLLIAHLVIFLLIRSQSTVTARPTHLAVPNGCKEGTVNVVAHEDDDISFLNPDIQSDISKNKCVTTVYTTAGAYSTGPQSTLRREDGPKAAYAEMAGKPDRWVKSYTRINGHRLMRFRLINDPKICLIFMILPNSKGGDAEEGFSFYSDQDLQLLFEGKIKTITATDNSTSYTLHDLEKTLARLFQQSHPSIVRTQDFSKSFGYRDEHSDHLATARITQIASQQAGYNHVLIGYWDYPTRNFPANLSSDQTQEKQKTFFAYAKFDSHVCQSIEGCQAEMAQNPQYAYYSWFSREYIAGVDYSP